MQILDNFRCIPEYEGSSVLYLEAAPWIECSVDSSKSVYFWQLFVPSVVCAMAYIIGFPLLIWVMLYRNRQKLESHRVETMVGFMYENYKPRLWWVEVVLIGRRILIAAAMSLIPEGHPLSLEIVLVVLVTFLFLFQFLQPYRNRTDVNCEIVSIVSLLILINTGTSYQEYETNKAWLNTFGLVVYLGILVMLVLVMIYPQLKFKIFKVIGYCYSKVGVKEEDQQSLLANQRSSDDDMDDDENGGVEYEDIRRSKDSQPHADQKSLAIKEKKPYIEGDDFDE